MTSKIEAIAARIKEGNRFLIASHLNPDGDAIGASLALALALKAMGKEVVTYNRDSVPYQFLFLKGADRITSELNPDDSFDAVFVLDCSELERVEKTFGERVKTKCWINIDHHLTNKTFADISIIDKDACSTGYLVYLLIEALPVELTIEIAENIYTTIIFDTGSFRYSNSTKEAFRVAGELVGLGVSPWEVAHRIYENQPLGRIKLLSKVLETLHISGEGKVASVTVSLKMMEETNTGHDATDGFVNYPRSIEGVEVAMQIRETGNNVYKLSCRSKGTVNVAAMAERYGGGGHRNAAGCVMKGTLEEVRKEAHSVVDAIVGEDLP